MARPTLPVEPFETADGVIPALAAVVPEKVRGLSVPPLALEAAPAEREPARAAPALAGLCFGFIPAARPLDDDGGRPKPNSVDVDVDVDVEAADPVRVRSGGFLWSVLLWAGVEVFADPAVDEVTAFMLDEVSVLTSLDWVLLESETSVTLARPELADCTASACNACSTED